MSKAPWLVLLLSACSVIASGKAKAHLAHSEDEGDEKPAAKSDDAPSKPAKASKAGGGGGLQVDDNDEPYVARAIERLDAMAKLIDAKDWAKYAHESHDFQSTILYQHGWEDSKKHDAMLARLNELDTAAFKAYGGRLAKVGDGKRVTKLDSDAVEAAEAMVDACHKAAGTQTTGQGEASAALTKSIAAYDKAMARAIKMDPNVMRYYGEAGRSGTIDVPIELMECELQINGAAAQFGDEYAPEVAEKTEEETGCGEVDFWARGVMIGANSFGPYERVQGGASYTEQIDCKKIPKHGNTGKAHADAIKDFAEYAGIPVGKLVVVLDGKPKIEVDEEDLHTYRGQSFKAYSKVFKFTKNPCGPGKTFCEAGGSQSAAAYNRLEFALERAEAHAGKDPDACKRQLKEAKAQVDWFVDFHDKAVKSGDWVAGATYKTKKGQKLTEKQLIAAFAEKGKQIEDKVDNRFCSGK